MSASTCCPTCSRGQRASLALNSPCCPQQNVTPTHFRDRDDVVHLFGERLPAFAQALAWLAELKTGGDSSLLGELRGWTSQEAARVALWQLTGEAPQGERIGARA
jgi:hypothetical protein